MLLASVRVAEDVVQDTLLECWRELGRLRGDDAVALHLRRVATELSLAALARPLDFRAAWDLSRKHRPRRHP